MTLERKSQVIEAGESPDVSWNSLEDEIKEKLEKIFDFSSLKRWGESDEKIEKRKKELLEREKNFFLRTLAAVQKAKEKNPKTAVLFDIDDTINASEFDASGKKFVTLRPSFIPLLEKIGSMGAEAGFITDCGEKYIEKQLEDEKNLLPAKKFINPRLIFSCRRIEFENASEFLEKIESEFGGADGIIDSNFLSSCRLVNGDQAKLKILKQIRAGLDDEALVIVDDLDYPKLLNEKNNLYGVSLGNKAKFTGP